MTRHFVAKAGSGPHRGGVIRGRASYVLRRGNRAVHRLSCGCCDRTLELVDGRWVRRIALTKYLYVLFWLIGGLTPPYPPQTVYRLVDRRGTSATIDPSPR